MCACLYSICIVLDNLRSCRPARPRQVIGFVCFCRYVSWHVMIIVCYLRVCYCFCLGVGVCCVISPRVSPVLGRVRRRLRPPRLLDVFFSIWFALFVLLASVSLLVYVACVYCICFVYLVVVCLYLCLYMLCVSSLHGRHANLLCIVPI